MLMEIELDELAQMDAMPRAEDWRSRLAEAIRRLRPWVPLAPHWPLWVLDSAKTDRILAELDERIEYLSTLLDVEAEPVEPTDSATVDAIDKAVLRIEALAHEIDGELRQSAFRGSQQLAVD